MPIIKCMTVKCRYYAHEEPDHCRRPLKAILECPDADLRKPRDKPDNFYYDALMSEECQCGGTKKPGYALCFSCYHSLPKDLQRDLYSRIGDGFESAYDAVILFLED